MLHPHQCTDYDHRSAFTFAIMFASAGLWCLRFAIVSETVRLHLALHPIDSHERQCLSRLPGPALINSPQSTSPFYIYNLPWRIRQHYSNSVWSLCSLGELAECRTWVNDPCQSKSVNFWGLAICVSPWIKMSCGSESTSRHVCHLHISDVHLSA